jgi:hypothetical protein
MIIQSVVVIFILAAVAGSLLSISTTGSKLEQSRDYKFKSREIAEAALDLSLNALRQATDGCDNDGDGDIDEGLLAPNIFLPSAVAKLEGNLGRIGTVNWTLGDDSNGNGLPDFGEKDVVPVTLSGGDVITYSVFSENDGLDNDNDGSFDEDDEKGSLFIVSQGRYNKYNSLVRYSGIFTEKWHSGGDLTVLGNCTIYGVQGNVHSNGFLDLSGSSSIAGNATSSNGGNIDPACVSGTVNTSAPKQPVPDATLNNVLGLREQAVIDGMDVYLLKNNGSVDLNGTIVSPGGTYHGWAMGAGGEWTLSGNKADLHGLFYAAGDVYIQGGNQAVSITEITEGNIAISGNGNFTPYYEKFFAIALQDIKLQGNPAGGGELGAVLAREQIMTEGNSFLRGTILAADLDHNSDFVLATTVQGTFDVEYNGGFTSSFPVFNPDDFKYKFDPTFSGYEER